MASAFVEPWTWMLPESEPVNLRIPTIGISLAMPICFADGDTSQIIGREGFFDCFRIEFDKPNFVTKFELIEEE